MKKEVMSLLFNLGHNFSSWQCSATCCQDDNARPHVARMTMLGHMLPGWHCRSSLTLNIRFCHMHHIHLIFHSPTTHFFVQAFLCQKTFSSKGEVETAFKDFLTSKPLGFYHRGTNNLVNWWQKCIDVQGSCFDCVNTLFKFIHLGIKKYSKIRLYFPNNLNYLHTFIRLQIFLSIFFFFGF